MDKTEEVIDGSNSIIMPGLINSHTHVGMAMFKGYGDGLPLDEWLNKKIFPIEAKLKPEHVYWSTMLSCMEMIKSGTTCFSDMYYFMDQTEKATIDIGMRGFLSRGLIDIDGNGEEKLKQALKHMKIKHPRISWGFGPHAIYTCSEEYLKKIKESAGKKKIHMHVSETKKEFDDCMKKHKKTPVEYLNDIGMIDENFIGAHGCYLTENDIDILKKSTIVNNPCSNMKLASGIAPVYDLIKKGVNVCIGTDGVSSNNNLDMFEEMKFSSLVQKCEKRDASILNGKEILNLATTNGAKSLGLNTGELKPGKKADMIMIDLDSINLKPLHDIYSSIVYSCHGNDVKNVIIDGKMVMENRVLNIDEEQVYEKIDDFKQDLFS